MNKEEKELIENNIVFEDTLLEITPELMEKTIVKFGKEKKELQDRIDKAIEELKTLSNLYDDNYTISDKAKDIIEILKGE